VAMVTLHGRSNDPFEYENDRLRNLITGGGAAIVAMMLVIGIGTGIAGCINGSAQKQAIDPNDTVTFHGQIFGHFEPEDVNAFYGIAGKVRGRPLPMDPLWNLLPARDEITVDGLVYKDCEGVGPRVTDRLRYQELVCKR
jgi:hypothetical protein